MERAVDFGVAVIAIGLILALLLPWNRPTAASAAARPVPAAPTNVRVTAYKNCVDVEWDAVAGVAGYQVYRKTGAAGTYALLNSTGVVLGTRYRDSTVVTGTTYVYKVTAVDP